MSPCLGAAVPDLAVHCRSRITRQCIPLHDRGLRCGSHFHHSSPIRLRRATAPCSRSTAGLSSRCTAAAADADSGGETPPHISHLNTSMSAAAVRVERASGLAAARAWATLGLVAVGALFGAVTARPASAATDRSWQAPMATTLDRSTTASSAEASSSTSARHASHASASTSSATPATSQRHTSRSRNGLGHSTLASLSVASLSAAVLEAPVEDALSNVSPTSSFANPAGSGSTAGSVAHARSSQISAAAGGAKASAASMIDAGAAAKAKRTEEDVLAYVRTLRDQHLQEHPAHADKPWVVDAAVAALLRGVPLTYDELMRSAIYDPNIVPHRNSRMEIHETLKSIMDQYDAEDFDLGIKQFMIEAKVKAQMEAGGDRGPKKTFEERLSEALFADDQGKSKTRITPEEVVDDAFTTEMMEEAILLFGEGNSLRSAWRVHETLTEMAYSQMWTLAAEGHIDKARFYGPQTRAMLVTTRASAPGGVRTAKVVVPPDPDLFDHLISHGVAVHTGEAALDESTRLGRAFLVQVLRYTFPFMVISGVFWLLHTWLLDPVPNSFRRQEFIKYRRELLLVASKLNFRSPARQVNIDTTSPDFIPWDEIHGIDAVKAEIDEIIEFLKNPALLRAQGVARIGGVLLAGAPGTGKTLLAKSIAAESGVQMFTCSGTDFYDVYSGVGARRIRETFDKIRNAAPAILFVDEFDALGAARGQQSSGDESASIINELLVQMDGFEDNRGIVVLGATNRPGAIDSALIRPGRFDRIIYMPLPDAAGRAKILQVHARGKAVDPLINWYEVSRAMAGFTGADCMGLMQRAARMAARQGRERIEEEDIYAAMENKAMEGFQELTSAPQAGQDGGTPAPIPLALRKAVAVYEAGKAMLAYVTPDFEEVARVSVCPFDIITGYTLFVEDEEKGVNAVLTRSEMEAHMVVNLAGRCAEKLVLGESEVTGLGAPDLFHANMIAREMILEMGMGRRTGPLDLMHVMSQSTDANALMRTSENSGEEGEGNPHYYHATDMSTEQSRVALAEVVELLEAAEAKAYYGLAMNWKPLNALVDKLLEQGVLQGREVAHILETNGVIHFPDPTVQGFGWEPDGELQYPFKTPRSAAEVEGAGKAAAQAAQPPTLKGLASKTWFAGTNMDAPRDADGKFRNGWHWNMPYTVRKDLPDWYNKEVQRFAY